MSDDKKSPWGKPGGNGGGKKPTGNNSNSPWGKPTGKPGPKPVRPVSPIGGKPDRSRPNTGQGSNDLENLIKGFKSRRGGPRGPGGGGGRGDVPGVPKWVLLAGVAAYLVFTSIYTVQGNEQAAVLRFGDYVRTAGPGLNFKAPYPIETKMIEEVTRQREITVGQTDAESLMVTGDENIVDLQFTVLYIINDLESYLFKVDGPDALVKATAESVVREVVGQNELESIITTERARLIAQVTEQLQGLLDEYEAGVQVIDVQFQRTDPPEGAVRNAFDRVVASDQQAEAAINQARAEFNKVTLEAEGLALARVQEAEAYRDQVIAIAEGEASRFTQVYEQYKLAPEVTRRRIYLETIEDIYGDAEKVVLDSEAGSGVVPYLPLNELNRNSGGGQ